MKYWRGYLVAGIFAAIALALTAFAKAHTFLVDMIYPYISRMVVSTLADWTGGASFCVWQALLLGLIALGVASIVLMILLKWHPVQWFGWVLAVISCIFMCNSVLYGLNQYASPLADDMRLEVTDYNVSELNEAAIFFRDKANALALEVARDEKGDPNFGTFEEMAQQAGQGFDVLTYEKTISVFAGSTAPVKKQTWFATKGDSGMLVPLTGEVAVNPKVPAACMPFAMGKEMAHRLAIYSDADASFAGFYAGIHNESVNFQYSAYLMAYHYCYQALKSIPTSTAQAAASQTNNGANALLKADLEDCYDFYGDRKSTAQIRTATRTLRETTPATQDPTGESISETTPTESTQVDISFSSYTDVADLLASWYIQEYITPLHKDEEVEFNPYDSTQVDLSGNVNAKVGS